MYEFGTDIPNKMFKEAHSNFGLFTQFWQRKQKQEQLFRTVGKYINAWLQITVFRHKRFPWQLLQRIIETWSASIIDNYKIKPVNPQEGSSDLFSRFNKFPRAFSFLCGLFMHWFDYRWLLLVNLRASTLLEREGNVMMRLIYTLQLLVFISKTFGSLKKKRPLSLLFNIKLFLV